jgi:hypothetical protein
MKFSHSFDQKKSMDEDSIECIEEDKIEKNHYRA